MDDDRKFRLIEKGETDLYIYALLKEIEEKVTSACKKIDIVERRLCLIEDDYIDSISTHSDFDDICEDINQFILGELEKKHGKQNNLIIAISNTKEHYFNDFSNNYGFSKYTDAFEKFCSKIIESDIDDCPYHK